MRLRHSVVIANGSRRAVLSSSSAARLPSTSSIALSNATSNNPSNNYNFECGIQPLKRWESTSVRLSFLSTRDVDKSCPLERPIYLIITAVTIIRYFG